MTEGRNTSTVGAARVGDIARFVETWAPPASAQSYDNVGLLVGRPERDVRRALIALDLTPAVIEEAIDLDADLIITHHPLIFRPLRSLSPSSLPGAMALRLAEAGVALYAAHTNLDAAKDGVSFALAGALGLTDLEFLEPLVESRFKLVTFVPSDHIDGVREALAEAGAGRIGEYDACAFISEGTGFFRAGATARPFIGQAGGGIEQADEIRLEVELARWDLARTIDALRAAHPYEEVAYDVYPVMQPSTLHGMGAVGNLPAPQTLQEFLDRVSHALQSEAVRYAGAADMTIRRVAVCGGSGGDLIRAATRTGANAFVTADLTYHRFFDTMNEAGDVTMALIDAGHYETEAMTESLLAQRLSSAFPDVAFDPTRTRTSPIRWHLRS